MQQLTLKACRVISYSFVTVPALIGSLLVSPATIFKTRCIRRFRISGRHLRLAESVTVVTDPALIVTLLRSIGNETRVFEDLPSPSAFGCSCTLRLAESVAVVAVPALIGPLLESPGTIYQDPLYSKLWYFRSPSKACRVSYSCNGPIAYCHPARTYPARNPSL